MPPTPTARLSAFGRARRARVRKVNELLTIAPLRRPPCISPGPLKVIKAGMDSAQVVAAAFALLLVVAAGVSVWQAVRATRAEATARAEADRATAISEFLTEDLLLQASPSNHAVSERVTLREVVDRAVDRAGERFRTRPLVEAALRSTIGETYASLGAWDSGRQQFAAARALYERELGPDSPEAARLLARLGKAWRQLGQYPEAEGAALKGRLRISGEQDIGTLWAMELVGWIREAQGNPAGAEPLLVEGLKIRQRVLGEEHHETINAMLNLAGVYLEQCKLREAGQGLHQAHEVVTRHAPDGSVRRLSLKLAVHLSTMAAELAQAGRVDEAGAAYREALSLTEARMAEVPDQPAAQGALAWLLATCPVPQLRDPVRVVELAREAISCSMNRRSRDGRHDRGPPRSPIMFAPAGRDRTRSFPGSSAAGTLWAWPVSPTGGALMMPKGRGLPPRPFLGGLASNAFRGGSISGAARAIH
jgi:tetratricopeptide (TPR) repeat protein